MTPMQKKLAVGGAGLALFAGGVAVGRSTKPAEVRTYTAVVDRVITKTETVTVERRVEGPVRERTTVREVPGGERVVTHEVEREPVVTERASGSTTSSRSERTEVAERKEVQQSRLMLGAAVGSGLDLKPYYAGELRYRVVGPLWLGVSANTRGEALASVAFTF